MNVTGVNSFNYSNNKASVNNTRNNQVISFKQLKPIELKFLNKNRDLFPDVIQKGEQQLIALGSRLTEHTKEASDLRDNILRGIIKKILELKQEQNKVALLQIA